MEIWQWKWRIHLRRCKPHRSWPAYECPKRDREACQHDGMYDWRIWYIVSQICWDSPQIKSTSTSNHTKWSMYLTPKCFRLGQVSRACRLSNSTRSRGSSLLTVDPTPSERSRDSGRITMVSPCVSLAVRVPASFLALPCRMLSALLYSDVATTCI